MQRVAAYRRPRRLQPLVEFEGKCGVHQLADAVCLHCLHGGRAEALALEVAEVDRAKARRAGGHNHNAGCGAEQALAQQQRRQQEVSQVVHRCGDNPMSRCRH